MLNRQETAQETKHLHNPIVWTTKEELLSVLEHLAQKSPVLAKWFRDLAQTSGVVH